MIRCSSSRSTSTEKSTPVALVIARTASWTGFPSMTPQVALGSPIRRALWSASVVSSPARPGATIFGPPLKPAKKCGSTKPGRDPEVRLDPLACKEDRHVVDHGPRSTRLVRSRAS